jgi:hypothetical protein
VTVVINAHDRFIPVFLPHGIIGDQTDLKEKTDQGGLVELHPGKSRQAHLSDGKTEKKGGAYPDDIYKYRII